MLKIFIFIIRASKIGQTNTTSKPTDQPTTSARTLTVPNQNTRQKRPAQPARNLCKSCLKSVFSSLEVRTWLSVRLKFALVKYLTRITLNIRHSDLYPGERESESIVKKRIDKNIINSYHIIKAWNGERY